MVVSNSERQGSQVAAYTGTCQHHRDRAHRAGIRANAMSNAFVAVDDHGLATDHPQHVAFRAHHRARRTTDAVVIVDVRMLRLRAVGSQFALFRRFFYLYRFFLFLLQVVRKEAANDDGSD